MRRINALEAVGGSINTGTLVLAPAGVLDAGTWEAVTQKPEDWRLGEDGKVYSLHEMIAAGELSSEFNYVRIYELDGTLADSFGNYYIDDADPAEIRTTGDIGIGADADGNFYIRSAKVGNQIWGIKKCDSSGAIIDEWEISSSFVGWALRDLQVRGSYVYALAEGDNRATPSGTGTEFYRKVLRFDLDGANRTELLSVSHTSSFATPSPRGLAVHENGYFWMVSDPASSSTIDLYDDSGTLVSSISNPWTSAFFKRPMLGLSNTYWAFASSAYRQYTHLGVETGRFVSFLSTYPFEDTLGVMNYLDGTNSARWYKTYTGQTTFYAYTPTATSLGAPNGGVSVPALNKLSPTVTAGSKLAAQIIEDMREPIERLAPFYVNAVTTDPFNWTAADVDNLYSVAVDTTDYGDSGTQYDWHRTKAAMYDTYPVARDIGEIEDCITLLEASTVIDI